MAKTGIELSGLFFAECVFVCAVRSSETAVRGTYAPGLKLFLSYELGRTAERNDLTGFACCRTIRIDNHGGSKHKKAGPKRTGYLLCDCFC
jgi:hypothetical protein